VTQSDSHIASVVGWKGNRLSLLVGAIVSLIHNNQSQATDRRKQSRARTDEYLSLTPTHLIPDGVPLTQGELAVHHRDAARKTRFEAAHCLSSQADLRYEDNAPPARLENPVQGAEIDLRLAGASDAVEKGDKRRFGAALRHYSLLHLPPDRLLVACQPVRFLGTGRTRTVVLLRVQAHKTAYCQSLERSEIGAGLRIQSTYPHPPLAAAQRVQYSSLSL
jgi:hypothetical protein